MRIKPFRYICENKEERIKIIDLFASKKGIYYHQIKAYTGEYVERLISSHSEYNYLICKPHIMNNKILYLASSNTNAYPLVTKKELYQMLGIWKSKPTTNQDMLDLKRERLYETI